jgi:hypothetical protein
MRRRRKLLHVQADLREQAPGRDPVDAGNRAEPRNLSLKRAQAPIDLLFDRRHLPFGVVQVVEQLTQHEAMMRRDAPRQCLAHRGNLVPEQTFRQLRECLDVGFPRR